MKHYSSWWPLILASSFVVTDALAGPVVHYFAPSPSDADGYNETFTFSADFPDGGFAQAQFGITNMGPGSGRALCRLFVDHPFAKWRGQEVVANDEWSYQKKPAGTLQIGKCRVTTTPRTEITATTEQGELRLTLHEELQVRAPKGEWNIGEFEFTTHVYAMAATADAQLIKPDGKVFRGPARVWIEHSRATHSPDKFGRSWLRFRSLDDGPPVAGLVRNGAQGRTGAGWILRADGTSEQYTGELAASPDAFVFKTDHDLLRLRRKGEPSTYAPLREMGFLGRVLGAVVGDVELSSSQGLWIRGTEQRPIRIDTTDFR